MIAPKKGGRSMRIVVAVHSREVKTALFIALNAIPSVIIVATATTTSELIGYAHAFRPDALIVEFELPGKALPDVLEEVESSMTPERILVIGGDDAAEVVGRVATAEILRDVEHLLEVLTNATSEEGV